MFTITRGTTYLSLFTYRKLGTYGNSVPSSSSVDVEMQLLQIRAARPIARIISPFLRRY